MIYEACLRSDLEDGYPHWSKVEADTYMEVAESFMFNYEWGHADYPVGNGLRTEEVVIKCITGGYVYFSVNKHPYPRYQATFIRRSD